MELTTPRLSLRHWRDTDRAPYAALNADGVVMEHFTAPLSPAESDAHVDAIETAFAQRGWGLWAAERTDTGAFIGFIGLSVPRFEAPFTPCVEVGWRLARAHWGLGFAPEGATAALSFAFDVLRLPDVVSFTTVANARSRRVMDKVGMVHEPDGDFDHPDVPPGSPICRHVLYRVTPQSQAQTLRR